MSPAQGEIWWAELPDAGRRPVMVVTRTRAIGVLRTILVAPITRTVRGILTEIPLSSDDGLPTPCAATFDTLQPVPRWALTERAGAAEVGRHSAIGERLRAMADCG
ncbi:type II toxin-antitoxin system PemK/MazF family toxin [soil metagenome]